MISNRITHNLFAVSAGKMETGINAFQALDTTFLLNESDIFNFEVRRETNEAENNGKDEADRIYDRGRTGAMGFTKNMAQPQDFALMLAFALGKCESTSAGSGFLHTITPMDEAVDESRDLKTFSACYRYGKDLLARRIASFCVDSVAMPFATDEWVKITGQLKATGKVEESVTEEVISAAENATTLTLAANGVAGSTDAERLSAIHAVRAETSDGVWEEVAVSAVTSATPAEITITAPGTGTDSIRYRVLYAPTAAAWQTFPARVMETGLRVSDVQVVLGGQWDGSQIKGGRDISAQLGSIEANIANAAEVRFGFGAGGAFASRIKRGQRQQTLKVDQEFRDLLLKTQMDAGEYFAVRILAEGPEYESGHKYSVEMIYPMVGVLNHSISANGKELAQQGDLAVLQHSTYGSVIAKVKNLVAGYAA